MSKVVTCKSCGAENDIIFEDCIYCRSTLDRNELEIVSNEDLVSNASSWIEKIHEDRIKISSVNGKGKKVQKNIQNSEIKSYARKYLSILQYRSLRNPELNTICMELSNRFTSVSKRHGLRLPLIGAVFFVLMLMFIIIGLCSENSVDKKKDREVKRIEVITNEVSNLIKNNDYANALIKAEQITWTYDLSSWSSREDSLLVNKYDNQRNEIKKTIIKLMEENSRE